MATIKERKYLSVREIQKEYLPLSVKKIREFLKNNTTVTTIGGRMYVLRDELELAINRCGCADENKE